jgi:hypothetical protein
LNLAKANDILASNMADSTDKNKKIKQLSLEEYAKVKEQRAKSRLKLQFPLIVKVCIIIPALYCTFMLVYYLMHLRFLAEH